MNGDLRIYPKSGYVVATLANIDPPAAQRVSEWVCALLLSLPAKRSGSRTRARSSLWTRATNRATKLREPHRTDSASERLNKPHRRQRTSFCRYRTQEVAGSSPASSTSPIEIRPASQPMMISIGSTLRFRPR